MTPERWHQVTEMFHAARACAPERRGAFVAEACGEDATLRREVETMLAGHDAAGQFGETPLFASMPPLELTSSVLGTQPKPPRSRTWRSAPVLASDRMKSSRALGAGGMGEVYRAHDTRLSRDVAIKTLPSTFADNPERLARFRREARMLASLNHPKIAAIYGLEKSGDLEPSGHGARRGRDSQRSATG